jgi:hypothetical protein
MGNKRKILINIYPMLKDIDHLERTLILLKQSYPYVNHDSFHIILNVTLPISDYLIDWDSSILKQDYFITKFEHLKKYGDCWDECYFNIDSHSYGLLDNFTSVLSKHNDVDDVILLETDIVFNPYTLGVIIDSSSQLSSQFKEYIITPEHTKLWDSSWDVITNSNFINKPYYYRDIAEPLLDVAYNGQSIEIIPMISNSQKFFKFGGGWFVLYSKELLDKINFPSDLKGYGPLDNFIIQYCSYSGVPTQYKIQNIVITEDCKYTQSGAYDPYVKTLNRKQDLYEKNNKIMFEHFKNKFGF